MRSFIHHLNTPACITSFNGSILDVNTWFVKSFEAKSKAILLQSNIAYFIIDNEKYKQLIAQLLTGDVIQNEVLYVADMNENRDTKIIFASIFSTEKQQIFIQFFEIFSRNHPAIVWNEPVFTEISKLQPYLTNRGKKILFEILGKQKGVFKGSEFTYQITGIKNTLENNFPMLTENEIQLSALLIMGFSTVEISVYEGYLASNVRSIVFRICKKLEVDSLEELLNAFQLISPTSGFYP